MISSSRRFRRALWLSAAAAAAVTVAVTGLTSSVTAAPALPGYRAPQGIYAPFTNCPLNSQAMHESTQFTLCISALAVNGSITLGNITTTVVSPVQVQFGAYTPPNATNYATVQAPPGGTAAQLKTAPDLIPESLTKALGCPSTNTTVEALCTEAGTRGGNYNTVYALAQSAGAITNFNLVSWTQPIKFQLVNPLLGTSCYIGQDGLPAVLNPSLTLNSANIIYDPHPTTHPDTFVIVANATASDTTFAAPQVTGCGPGGAANIAVDEAIDASAGLPAASGVNSLTLTGAFDIAACSASGDSSLPQPQDDAAILLSAFNSSSSVSANSLVKHSITAAQIRKLLK
jgi:hypothetical protein